MELEEHDEDLTDIVPANRGVQDLRAQPGRGESPRVECTRKKERMGPSRKQGSRTVQARNIDETGQRAERQSSLAATPAPPAAGLLEDRERGGGWRGRRRRRGGRRDGRGDGRDEGRERGSEPRLAGLRSSLLLRLLFLVRRTQAGPSSLDRQRDTSRCCFRGESISKYRGLAQTPAVQERHCRCRD